MSVRCVQKDLKQLELLIALRILEQGETMTKEEALKLALEALGNTWTEPKSEQYKIEKEALTAIKKALAQPEYRAVKTFHEGKPVYVAQQEPSHIPLITDEEWAALNASE